MEEEILVDFQFNDNDVKSATKLVDDFSASEQNLIAINKQLIAQGQQNSKAFTENQSKIKGLNDKISENSKIVTANSQAQKSNSDNLKKYSDTLSVVNPSLGGFAGNLGKAAEGSGSFTGGILSMVKASLAFLATPIGAAIGALVLVFKLLETYVTGSTEGMDKFEDVMSTVGVVIDVVTDRVVSLVKGIGKFLSGDFSGGLDDIKNSFEGIGDEIEREVSLTLDLNKAIRELEDAEVNYDIAASKTSNTIKELLLQAKNRTLSEKERIALLTKATDLESGLNKTNIANKLESLRITNEEANRRVQLARIQGETEEEFAQRLIDTGKLLDPLRDKVKDTIVAYNSALGEGIAVREKVQNQIDALAEKSEADAKKRAEAEQKRLEDLAKKRAELAERDKAAFDQIEILRLKSQADEIKDADAKSKKLIEIEDVKLKNALDNDQLTEGQRQLLTAQSEEAIKQIKINAIAANREAQDKDLAEALDSFKAYSQELINIEKQRLLDGVITQEDYNQQIADLNIAALEAEKVVKEQFGQDDLSLQGQITDAKIALSKKEADAKQADEDRKLNAVKNGLAVTASAFNKQSLAFKLLSSASALIDTYKGATAAFSSLAEIPIVGPVLGGIAAAAAIIAGLKNVATINSVALPKMAQGGAFDITGPSHTAGGVDVSIGNRKVANVEGGEKMVIMSKDATGLLNKLGGINAMAGGVDFGIDQRTRTYMADGGTLARSASAGINQVTGQSIADSLKGVTIVTKLSDIDRLREKVEIANTISELV